MVIADRVLVLRKGVVQQHGTPYHVYRKPNNLFVANFVGSTSFFEGVVISCELDSSTIHLRGDLTVTIDDTSHQPEEDIVIAIRDERIRFALKGSGSGQNMLPGEVTAARFLGRHNRFEARLTNGDYVASLVPSSRYDIAFKVGDRVDVMFDPSQVLVFGYPSRGLIGELEVY
jgi:ABC-type Fe3+/spermidine/putrescine transport system ATPase subunit